MRLARRLKISNGAVAVTGAVLVSLAGYTAPAGAAPAARLQATGGVLPAPAPGTPELVPTDHSPDEVIRQLVQCGDTMYAVGRFSSISQGGTVYSRANVLSFSASAPYTVIPWAPNVNGEVNSIAFNGSDCADAYIGGDFTSVNGTVVNHIAEIDTTAGNVVPGFGVSAAGGPVETLLGVNGHILVGGDFYSINGGKNKFMASVNPTTGQDDGFLQLHISGYYHYCNSTGRCSQGTHSEIYNQQLSHGGTLDLVEGNFTSVGGVPRQQIFMLNLATNPATVTGWTSPEWDGSKGNLPSGYPYQCWFDEAQYLRSAAWSPDDSAVYVAGTGFHPWNVPVTSPRSGLCDAVAAFPAAQTSVLHTWIEYSGCDSYYTVAADTSSVYVAGHPRWADNPSGCNTPGPGAVPDAGLQGHDPGTGTVQLNSGGKALYTMSRANADDMLITSAGLWIGSTNRGGANHCGTAGGHSGICLLPYSGS